MTSIKLHFWTLIFALWAIIVSLINPLLRDLLGMEGIYSQVMMILLTFVPLCTLYPLVHKNLPVKPYSFKPLSVHDLIWTIVLSVATWVFITFLYLLPWVSSELINSLPSYPIWQSILVSGILIAVFDELFFRGVSYSYYISNGVTVRHTAIITSVVSMVIHNGNPPLILFAMLIWRVIWIYMIHWTKSIFPAIIMHVTINTGAIVFFNQIISDENQEMIFIVMGILSLLALVIIYFGLKSMKARHDKNYLNDQLVFPQKSFSQAFNWLFWVFVALLLFMQFMT